MRNKMYFIRYTHAKDKTTLGFRPSRGASETPDWTTDVAQQEV
jgi:hypothetical protein